MGTHAGFDKASGCGCGCGSGSALGLGLLRAVAWLVGAPSTPCSRGANHTLTTHYSLLTHYHAQGVGQHVGDAEREHLRGQKAV